jgi:hypothetical protein
MAAIILPPVLYAYDILSLILKEGQSLEKFNERLLRISGPKRDVCQEAGENCIKSSFLICTFHRALLEL